MPAPRFALLATLAVLLANPLALGAGRRYRNPALRIAEFEVPRGWALAPASPYPAVLLLATSSDESPHRADGAPRVNEARLLLAGQHVVPGASALASAADARAALEKQGFGDPRIAPLPPGPEGEERVRLDALGTAGAGGRKVLRQAYVVEGDVLLVLTVIAPAARQARALQDFEAALASLVIEPAASAPSPSPAPSHRLPAPPPSPSLPPPPPALPPPGPTSSRQPVPPTVSRPSRDAGAARDGTGAAAGL